MAGVYSHDENPVPLEEDRAKAPVIQAPWEAFSSPQAASQGRAKHGAKCGATRNDRERRDGLLDVAAVLYAVSDRWAYGTGRSHHDRLAERMCGEAYRIDPAGLP